MAAQLTNPHIGQPHEGWLVLGPVDLIHSSGVLAGDDAVGLAAVPSEQITPAGNTVVVSFSELGPSVVTTKMVAGGYQTTERVAELFQDGLPSTGLTQLIRLTTRAPVRSTWVPLFYLAVEPHGGGAAVHVYSQIRFPGPDACFLRITDEPLHTDALENLEWLPRALEIHQQHAQFLNTHERHYRKWRPDQELEHKYTLGAEADIYRLAVDVRHALRDGALPEFMLRYRNEYECVDYLNYLFEVTAPASECGYISFMPTSDEAYIQKRKWFTEDAALRREQLTSGVVLDTSFDDYLERELGLQVRRMPRFRRMRYDVNLESARTGACFCILFDRCTLLDAPHQTLVQCELEYTRSRSLRVPAEADVLSDMETVACWLDTFLAQRQPGVQRGAYSKLSFLRDVTAGTG